MPGPPLGAPSLMLTSRSSDRSFTSKATCKDRRKGDRGRASRPGRPWEQVLTWRGRHGSQQPECPTPARTGRPSRSCEARGQHPPRGARKRLDQRPCQHQRGAGGADLPYRQNLAAAPHRLQGWLQVAAGSTAISGRSVCVGASHDAKSEGANRGPYVSRPGCLHLACIGERQGCRLGPWSLPAGQAIGLLWRNSGAAGRSRTSSCLQVCVLAWISVSDVGDTCQPWQPVAALLRSGRARLHAQICQPGHSMLDSKIAGTCSATHLESEEPRI